MKIRAVILARAAVVIHARSVVFLPDLIAALKDKYRFVWAPVAPSDILTQDGTMEFRHGKIVPPETGKSIVIDTMSVGPRAVVVDVATPTIHESTAEANYVLTDLIDWWNGSPFGAEDEMSPLAPRYYVSHLEVSFDNLFDRAFSRLEPVIGVLNSTIAKYAQWNHDPPLASAFRVQGVSLLIDPAHVSLPCDFRLERRAGWAYDAGVYFAQAPLGTDDHIIALAELEKALAAG